MRKLVLILLAAALVSSGAAFGGDQKTVDRKTIVQSCDKNLDGRIDLEEYHTRLTEVFFFVDADKNGYLTFTEIQKRVPDARLDRFKAADSNQDGRLTIGEYQNSLSKDFDAADTNEDGVLTPDEVDRMLQGP